MYNNYVTPQQQQEQAEIQHIQQQLQQLQKQQSPYTQQQSETSPIYAMPTEDAVRVDTPGSNSMARAANNTAAALQSYYYNYSTAGANTGATAASSSPYGYTSYGSPAANATSAQQQYYYAQQMAAMAAANKTHSHILPTAHTAAMMQMMSPQPKAKLPLPASSSSNYFAGMMAASSNPAALQQIAQPASITAVSTPQTTAKKRGRPKGSKNKPKQPIVQTTDQATPSTPTTATKPASKSRTSTELVAGAKKNESDASTIVPLGGHYTGDKKDKKRRKSRRQSTSTKTDSDDEVKLNSDSYSEDASSASDSDAISSDAFESGDEKQKKKKRKRRQTDDRKADNISESDDSASDESDDSESDTETTKGATDSAQAPSDPLLETIKMTLRTAGKPLSDTELIAAIMGGDNAQYIPASNETFTKQLYVYCSGLNPPLTCVSPGVFDVTPASNQPSTPADKKATDGKSPGSRARRNKRRDGRLRFWEGALEVLRSSDSPMTLRQLRKALKSKKTNVDVPSKPACAAQLYTDMKRSTPYFKIVARGVFGLVDKTYDPTKIPRLQRKMRKTPRKPRTARDSDDSDAGPSKKRRRGSRSFRAAKYVDSDSDYMHGDDDADDGIIVRVIAIENVSEDDFEALLHSDIDTGNEDDGDQERKNANSQLATSTATAAAAAMALSAQPYAAAILASQYGNFNYAYGYGTSASTSGSGYAPIAPATNTINPYLLQYYLQQQQQQQLWASNYYPQSATQQQDMVLQTKKEEMEKRRLRRELRRHTMEEKRKQRKQESAVTIRYPIKPENASQRDEDEDEDIIRDVTKSHRIVEVFDSHDQNTDDNEADTELHIDSDAAGEDNKTTKTEDKKTPAKAARKTTEKRQQSTTERAAESEDDHPVELVPQPYFLVGVPSKGTKQQQQQAQPPALPTDVISFFIFLPASRTRMGVSAAPQQHAATEQADFVRIQVNVPVDRVDDVNRIMALYGDPATVASAYAQQQQQQQQQLQ